MDLMKGNQDHIYYNKCAIESAFEMSKLIFIGVNNNINSGASSEK